MIIEIISGSLSVIANVTTLLQYRQQKSRDKRDKNLEEMIDQIQAHILVLTDQVSKYPSSTIKESEILSSYNSLLDLIRKNNSYSPHLEFRKTDGDIILAVKKKKPTILRDPEGEYR